MIEHTPGPWEVRAGPVGNGMLHVTSPSYRAECDANHVVCELRSWVRPDPAADARLICAAPDLLAALKSHIPWKKAGQPDKPGAGWGIWQDAIDAINKAEGGEW